MAKILFINTGTKRNLGDRAMLLNHLSIVKENGHQAFASNHLPQQFCDEFNVNRTPLFYHCFFRFAFLQKIQSLYAIAIFLHFSLCSLLLIIIKSCNIKNQSTLTELELIDTILSIDRVVFNGGGYLTDKGKWECWGCLLTGVLAILANKPIYISGVGVGPINSRITKGLLAFVFKRAKHIMVRDPEESAKLLNFLAVKNVLSLGDDAFGLATKNYPAQNKSSKLNLAAHFRLSPFTRNMEQKYQTFFQIIKSLNQQGWAIKFCIFAEQKSWELDLLSKAIEEFRLTNVEIIQSEDPRQLKSAISSCDLAIGIAYHFLVFALDSGIPSVGLYSGEYYRQKIQGLFKWFSRTHWTIDIDTLAVDECVQLLHKITEEESNYKENLLLQAQKLDMEIKNYLQDKVYE